MKISKFNVNRSKSDFCFKTASFVSDGLMSADDHILLHSLKEMSGKNIEQINVVGPDLTEISPKFEEAKEKLTEQNEKLIRLYYLTESQGYCGRVWDESSASPVAKTYCGNLTMLQQLPELLGLGGYLVQNDHTRRKLSPENHYFFEDGSEAKLDGTMGHYQWGWNRPFYITTWNENNLFFECISFEPIKGRESYYVPVGSMSAAGFAARDSEENRLVSYLNDSPRYRGGNATASDYDDNPDRTLLGRPTSGLNANQFLIAAKKNGQGWLSASVRIQSVLAILFHIIMGTRDSQAEFNPIKNSDGLYECGLGYGVRAFNNNYNLWMRNKACHPFLNLNECVEMGDYLGESNPKYITFKDMGDKEYTTSYNIPIFFGLKNPYGYLWQLMGDEFIQNNYHYIRKSIYSDTFQYGLVNDDVYTGTYNKINYNGNIEDISYNKLELFPIKVKTAGSQYYNDSFLNFGMRINAGIIRGGSAVYNLTNGLTAMSIGISYTNIDWCYSTYLCEFTEDFLLEPVV